MQASGFLLNSCKLEIRDACGEPRKSRAVGFLTPLCVLAEHKVVGESLKENDKEVVKVRKMIHWAKGLASKVH